MSDQPQSTSYTVGSRNGFVTVEWGREVGWVAFTREQAEAFAAEILRAAATVAPAQPAAAMGGKMKITIDDSKVWVRKADGTMVQ